MSILPVIAWKGHASGGMSEEQTDTSISETLAKARAERRAARFQLTVAPVTTGFTLLVAVGAAFIAGVPFVGSIAPFSLLLALLAILPSDTVVIMNVYRFTFFLILVLIILYVVLGIMGLSAAEDDKCYADDVSPSLDEEERVDCGWVLLVSTRFFILALHTLALNVWLLKGFLTIKDSGPLLDRLFRGKIRRASAPNSNQK